MSASSNRFTLLASFAFIGLLLLALHMGAMYIGLTPVLKGEMPDTDTYMRLVRVEEWVTGGGWFNSTTMRMNAPFGDTLNWSRPLDVIILLAALPLHQQYNMPWHDALFWGGAVISPLLQVLFGLAIAWMVAPFFPRLTRPLLMLYVCAQPMVFIYSMVGRPDQPALLLLSAALMLGFVIRVLLLYAPPLRMGLWAGMWAGLGLWVSPEFEFSLAIVVGTLALMWLWQGKQEIMELLEGIGIGFLLLTTLAVLAERGGEWASVRELDKVSLSQLIGACINCGLWGMTAWFAREGSGIARRTLSLGSMGVGALALVVFLAPELLRGPAGDIAPRVMEGFFLHIREMRPLIPKDAETASLMLLGIGVPLLGLPLWAWLYRREELSPWLPLVVYTLAFSGFALLHARFSQFAAPFGAIFLLAAVIRLSERLHGKPLLLRAGAQAFLLAAPILSALVLASATTPSAANTEEEGGGCNIASIKEQLNNLPKGIVMTSLNYGPELIYFTKHDTVAGPYHRNTEGLLDSLSFYGTGSEDDAARIIRRRGITYVLNCGAAQANAQTRAQRLSNGQIPGWLTPLELENAGDLRLFRVRENALP